MLLTMRVPGGPRAGGLTMAYKLVRLQSKVAVAAVTRSARMEPHEAHVIPLTSDVS